MVVVVLVGFVWRVRAVIVNVRRTAFRRTDLGDGSTGRRAKQVHHVHLLESAYTIGIISIFIYKTTRLYNLLFELKVFANTQLQMCLVAHYILTQHP